MVYIEPMLGNLFDGEEEAVYGPHLPGDRSIYGGSSSNGWSNWQVELQPRAESGFVGLKNQGMTCYLNSLLQTMFMTPELRAGLYQLTEEDLGIDFQKPKGVPLKVEEIPSSLEQPCGIRRSESLEVNVESELETSEEFTSSLADPMPMQYESGPVSAADKNAEDTSVNQLVAMGFQRARAKKALAKLCGNTVAAIDFLVTHPATLSDEEDEREVLAFHDDQEVPTSQSLLTSEKISEGECKRIPVSTGKDNMIVDNTQGLDAGKGLLPPGDGAWDSIQLQGTGPAVDVPAIPVGGVRPEETGASAPAPGLKRKRTRRRGLAELQKLFVWLQGIDKKALSTEDLTRSFGWDGDEARHQHDVHELNRLLFEGLEDSLKGTPQEALIQVLYHGKMVNQVVCAKCGKVSEREEEFSDIPVVVKGFVSLEESLSAATQAEELAGANQYFCEECGCKVDARRSTRIRKLPQVLTLPLCRFDYDWAVDERRKISTHFSFPLSIDMAPYMADCGGHVSQPDVSAGSPTEKVDGSGCIGSMGDDAGLGNERVPGETAATPLAGVESSQPKPHSSCEGKDKVDVEGENLHHASTLHEGNDGRLIYELLSVVIHSGSAHSGHYHAYIRDLFHARQGLAGLSGQKPSSAQKKPRTQAPAAAVFAREECVGGSDWQDQNEMAEDLEDARGGAAGSQGQEANHSGEEKVSKPWSNEPATSAPEKVHAEALGEAELQDAEAQLWYDFNDSNVAPMPWSAIKKQFGGSGECAYMLIYRAQQPSSPFLDTGMQLLRTSSSSSSGNPEADFSHWSLGAKRLGSGPGPGPAGVSDMLSPKRPPGSGGDFTGPGAVGSQESSSPGGNKGTWRKWKAGAVAPAEVDVTDQQQQQQEQPLEQQPAVAEVVPTPLASLVGMPKHLLGLLEEENRELQRERCFREERASEEARRAEAEAAASRIQLVVYLPSDCKTTDDGWLECRAGDPASTGRIQVVDKRNTVRQLSSLLCQHYGLGDRMPPREHLVLYVIGPPERRGDSAAIATATDPGNPDCWVAPASGPESGLNVDVGGDTTGLPVPECAADPDTVALTLGNGHRHSVTQPADTEGGTPGPATANTRDVPVASDAGGLSPLQSPGSTSTPGGDRFTCSGSFTTSSSPDSSGADVMRISPIPGGDNRVRPAPSSAGLEEDAVMVARVSPRVAMEDEAARVSPSPRVAMEVGGTGEEETGGAAAVSASCSSVDMSGDQQHHHGSVAMEVEGAGHTRIADDEADKAAAGGVQEEGGAADGDGREGTGGVKVDNSRKGPGGGEGGGGGGGGGPCPPICFPVTRCKILRVIPMFRTELKLADVGFVEGGGVLPWDERQGTLCGVVSSGPPLNETHNGVMIAGYPGYGFPYETGSFLKKLNHDENPVSVYIRDNTEKDSTSAVVFSVSVTSNTTVAELKARALAQRPSKVILIAEETVLRRSTPTAAGDIIANEALTLRKAFVEPHALLWLEKGTVDEALLTVCVNVIDKFNAVVMPNVRVAVPWSATVGECKACIFRVLAATIGDTLDGTKTHLRRTSGRGLMADVLDDDSLTIKTVGLSEGELLWLVEGEAPSSLISLFIYRYWTPEENCSNPSSLARQLASCLLQQQQGNNNDSWHAFSAPPSTNGMPGGGQRGGGAGAPENAYTPPPLPKHEPVSAPPWTVGPGQVSTGDSLVPAVAAGAGAGSASAPSAFGSSCVAEGVGVVLEDPSEMEEMMRAVRMSLEGQEEGGGCGTRRVEDGELAETGRGSGRGGGGGGGAVAGTAGVVVVDAGALSPSERPGGLMEMETGGAEEGSGQPDVLLEERRRSGAETGTRGLVSECHQMGQMSLGSIMPLLSSPGGLVSEEGWSGGGGGGGRGLIVYEPGLPSSSCRAYVGEVKVSKEITVGALKEVLLDLPEFKVCAEQKIFAEAGDLGEGDGGRMRPSVDCLRLREIVNRGQKDNLGRTFHDESRQLCKYHIGNGRKIAVRVLPEHERPLFTVSSSRPPAGSPPTLLRPKPLRPHAAPHADAPHPPTAAAAAVAPDPGGAVTPSASAMVGTGGAKSTENTVPAQTLLNGITDDGADVDMEEIPALSSPFQRKPLSAYNRIISPGATFSSDATTTPLRLLPLTVQAPMAPPPASRRPAVGSLRLTSAAGGGGGTHGRWAATSSPHRLGRAGGITPTTLLLVVQRRLRLPLLWTSTLPPLLATPLPQEGLLHPSPIDCGPHNRHPSLDGFHHRQPVPVSRPSTPTGSPSHHRQPPVIRVADIRESQSTFKMEGLAPPPPPSVGVGEVPNVQQQQLSVAGLPPISRAQPATGLGSNSSRDLHAPSLSPSSQPSLPKLVTPQAGSSMPSPSLPPPPSAAVTSSSGSGQKVVEANNNKSLPPLQEQQQQQLSPEELAVLTTLAVIRQQHQVEQDLKFQQQLQLQLQLQQKGLWQQKQDKESAPGVEMSIPPPSAPPSPSDFPGAELKRPSNGGALLPGGVAPSTTTSHPESLQPDHLDVGWKPSTPSPRHQLPKTAAAGHSHGHPPPPSAAGSGLGAAQPLLLGAQQWASSSPSEAFCPPTHLVEQMDRLRQGPPALPGQAAAPPPPPPPPPSSAGTNSKTARVGGRMAFTPSMEVLFDAGREACDAASFSRFLSALFGIPVERMKVAKVDQTSGQWRLLPGTPTKWEAAELRMESQEVNAPPPASSSQQQQQQGSTVLAPPPPPPPAAVTALQDSSCAATTGEARSQGDNRQAAIPVSSGCGTVSELLQDDFLGKAAAPAAVAVGPSEEGGGGGLSVLAGAALLQSSCGEGAPLAPPLPSSANTHKQALKKEDVEAHATPQGQTAPLLQLSMGAANIRGKPFMLRDGDVIVVTDLADGIEGDDDTGACDTLKNLATSADAGAVRGLQENGGEAVTRVRGEGTVAQTVAAMERNKKHRPEATLKIQMMDEWEE